MQPECLSIDGISLPTIICLWLLIIILESPKEQQKLRCSFKGRSLMDWKVSKKKCNELGRERG